MSTIPATHGRSLVLRYCGQDIPAYEGQRLLDAILRFNPEHRHVCGGHGFCTTCRVEVLGNAGGVSRVTPLERERLGRDAGRLRLACQTMIYGDAEIRIPPPRPSLFPPDDE